MTIALFGFASISKASATVSEWTCKPENDTWCYDPSGLNDWRQGKVRLEKGYEAELCVGISKEGWETGLCTGSPVKDGEAFPWRWENEFSGHYPLHGRGLQYNSEGNAQEIWNWFYLP